MLSAGRREPGDALASDHLQNQTADDSKPHLRLEMYRNKPCRWYYKERSLVLADSCRHRWLDQSYVSEGSHDITSKARGTKASSRLYCVLRRPAAKGFLNPEVRSIQAGPPHVMVF